MRAVLGTVLLILVPVPSALAVNPLDDDARSGGDAGDVPQLAIPAAPGSHSGRLSPPHDIWDYYAVDGHAGQLVVLHLGSDGPAYPSVAGPDGFSYGGGDPGRTMRVLLPKEGPWYVVVTTGFVVLAPSVTEIPYVFDYHIEAPVDAAWQIGPLREQAAEFVWIAPTPAVVQARVSLPVREGKLPHVMFVVELGTTRAPHETWAGVIWTGGIGQSIRLVPAGVAVSLPTSVTVGTSGAVAWMRILQPDLLFARVAVHLTVEPLETLVSAFADAPFQRIFSQDVPAFVWDEDNAGASVQATVPGASVVGPRDLVLDLTRDSVAFFDTAGGQGSLTDPHGMRRDYDSSDPVAFLVAPEPGTWRFHLDTTIGVGGGASRVNLHKVEVPRLGLAP